MLHDCTEGKAETVGPRRERLDDCTEILCASSEALHTCSGESKLRAGHVAIQGVEKDRMWAKTWHAHMATLVAIFSCFCESTITTEVKVVGYPLARLQRLV